ncbi:LacI family DNA-binding transcriptional regulator [Paenibacillus alkalitolerans]|uniref:LacI family DNA-binding transcriptional regulator n=1 Tax=Paenibacillus alkalitolerans TaxID=2799335 RepID=UPI001F396A5A|nr:LacI family DNA-binding transcriptional regulator [Paenibacillus alkalitolerans]
MRSIKDVAKKANVSTATVSHVINNTRFVAEETKARVFQAMKELNYRPNSVARSLRSRRSNIIGLLVPIMPHDTSNFFFMSVAQGIEEVLKESGYNLILSNSREDITTEQDQIRVFNSQLIDGLIMAPTFEDHSYLHEVIDGDYPVVFIDRKPKDFQGDCVLTDGEKGTYDAVVHLIRSGHRRIGFITGSLGLTTSDERLAGYKKALSDHGIQIDENFIKVAASSYSSFESGYILAENLVTEQRTTALFVANNVMTMGALHYLQQKKIRIPGEISIIGFDDYEWAKITQPPLSMVQQPSFELGKTAANMLLKRIEQPGIHHGEIRLPTKVVLRDSC